MKYPQLVSMPSAVSDWLEEQLEARGIDAVIYTRYVLSLLHSDTVDIIYSDEDLHFSHLSKEVRRSGGNRKRSRRSSDWWRHAQADAEKLKRLAAIECLMSASEQDSEIEALVDELCEKLKSDVNTPIETPSKKINNSEQLQVSPQELAQRYYAAFPPLIPKIIESPSKLLEKWFQPSKYQVMNTNNRELRRSNEETLKSKRMPWKQRFADRFTYGRKAAEGSIENMEHNDTRKKSRIEVSKTNDSDQVGSNNSQCEKSGGDEILYGNGIINSLTKILNDDDDGDGGYLSPPRTSSMDMLNLASQVLKNDLDFVPYSMNVRKSLWSWSPKRDSNLSSSICNSTNASNSTLNRSLNQQPNDNTSFFSTSPMSRNVRTRLLSQQEQYLSNLPPATYDKFSKYEGSSFEDENISESLKSSYSMLNHRKGRSAFARVVPKNSNSLFSHCSNSSISPRIIPNIKPIGSERNIDDLLTSSRTHPNPQPIGFQRDIDDLLTSSRTHFRPINETVEETNNEKRYADGTTFSISSNLGNVSYTRTTSGHLYVDTDYGVRRKYCEFKQKTLPVDFVPKFQVSPNDVACQTDELDAEVAAVNARRLQLDKQRAEARKKKRCTCSVSMVCPLHVSKTKDDDDEDSGSEIIRKAIANAGTNLLSVMTIQKPHTADGEQWSEAARRSPVLNGSSWSDNISDERELQIIKEAKRVWQNADVMDLKTSAVSKPMKNSLILLEDNWVITTKQASDGSWSRSIWCDQNRLHEEVNRDGEELVSEIFSALDATSGLQRKPRHTMTSQVEDTWSFASRLEEDCIMQKSALPTLRSVTL